VIFLHLLAMHCFKNFFHVDNSGPKKLIFLPSHMGNHTNPYYCLHVSHPFDTPTYVQERIKALIPFCLLQT
jgi:hypothetical protein